MCAMIPMLRTRASADLTSAAATGDAFSSDRFWVRWVGVGRTAGSPAVVREGLVRLGHLVHVLAPLDARAEAVARVEQLVHQPVGHRLLAPLPRVGDEPAQRQRGLAR